VQVKHLTTFANNFEHFIKLSLFYICNVVAMLNAAYSYLMQTCRAKGIIPIYKPEASEDFPLH